MLLSTSGPLSFYWPKQVPGQDSCQWVREMCSTHSSWKYCKVIWQRVWMEYKEVTKCCRKQLNLSHMGRPASAHCQLSLFPVFVKDCKTLEKSQVPPFQIAEAWLYAVSAGSLSVSCLFCKVTDATHKQYFIRPL